MLEIPGLIRNPPPCQRDVCPFPPVQTVRRVDARTESNSPARARVLLLGSGLGGRSFVRNMQGLPVLVP